MLESPEATTPRRHRFRSVLRSSPTSASCCSLFFFFSEPILDNRSFYVWDLSEAYLPVQVDNARLRAAGEIPLWNRHVTLGYPINAETECSGIYPPALLFNVFDSPGRAFTAFILFHYLLALLATHVPCSMRRPRRGWSKHGSSGLRLRGLLRRPNRQPSTDHHLGLDAADSGPVSSRTRPPVPTPSPCLPVWCSDSRR